MKKTLLLASILPLLAACNSSETNGDNGIDSGIKPIQPIEPPPPVHPIEPGEPVHPIEPETPVEPENPIEPINYKEVAEFFKTDETFVYDLCETDYIPHLPTSYQYELSCIWDRKIGQFDIYYQERKNTIGPNKESYLESVVSINKDSIKNDQFLTKFNLYHPYSSNLKYISFYALSYWRDDLGDDHKQSINFDFEFIENMAYIKIFNTENDRAISRTIFQNANEKSFALEAEFNVESGNSGYYRRIHNKQMLSLLHKAFGRVSLEN